MLRKFFKKRYRDPEIAPDEIFLDSANVAEFDRSRFEGRIEKPLAQSSFWLVWSMLGLLFVILLGQAWRLQIVDGSQFAAESARNGLTKTTLFAERGIITDRNGVPLVTNTATEDGFVERQYKTPGFSSVLGYVSYPKKDSKGNYYDTELKGLAGIERSENDVLSGTDGTMLVEKNAVGKVVSQGVVIPPKNGTSIALSIDARAQTAMYDAISKLADRIPFQGGSGILMDAETGEIYAMVSYPEYDSNVLSSGGPSSAIASYANDIRHPYLNRPVQGLYTPGSVVKPIEAAAALTEGTIQPDYTINDTTGYITIPNPYDPSRPNKFVDWRIQGVEDLRKAIAFSSDIYFYIVGGGYQGKEGLGIDRLAKWFQTFGFTSPTGIELAGEASGFIPTPAWKEKTFGEKWNIGDTYHTAIGQYSMQITPLEEARAIAAIANGGTLPTPSLMKGGSDKGVVLPVTQTALQVVREGMRQGVTEGTSVGLSSLSFVSPAGKTGTAQLGYHNEYYNSWAVGFFPYTHPKYVYVMLMDHGPAHNDIGGVYATYEFLSALHASAPEYFE